MRHKIIEWLVSDKMFSEDEKKKVTLIKGQFIVGISLIIIWYAIFQELFWIGLFPLFTGAVTLSRGRKK